MPCALYPTPSPCNIIPCNPPSKSLFRHFSVLEKYAVCMLDFLKWYCDFRRKSLAVSSSFFFFFSLCTVFLNSPSWCLYIGLVPCNDRVSFCPRGVLHFSYPCPLGGHLGDFQLLAAASSDSAVFVRCLPWITGNSSLHSTFCLILSGRALPVHTPTSHA